MTSHQQSVHEQFDPQASAYLNSEVHAQGQDLLRVRELAASLLKGGAALDVGCGAGHLSFTLAPFFTRVVALDPSASMLETVQTAARAKGLDNIEIHLGSAGQLPFPDARFSLMATRYSAHHWLDLNSALREMRRVLTPGGSLLVIDVETAENALIDTHCQTLELLRDKSHVRNRSDAEWRQHLHDSNFEILEHRSWPLRLDFSSWVARIRTPAEKIAMLRMVQSEAPREVRDALAIESDGSFTLTTGLWWGISR